LSLFQYLSQVQETTSPFTTRDTTNYSMVEALWFLLKFLQVIFTILLILHPLET